MWLQLLSTGTFVVPIADPRVTPVEYVDEREERGFYCVSRKEASFSFVTNIVLGGLFFHLLFRSAYAPEIVRSTV